ncbi:MAG: ATP-binding protein [Clostridiaceae bacterium]|nr:ATP-binding protein [Clostridiaceae bacterium]
MECIFNKRIIEQEYIDENQRLERKNKITEQQNEQLKQQNEQLQKQNEQLISIIENLSEGVILADNNGEFLMVNPEAKKLIYQSDEVIDIGNNHKNSKAFDLKGNAIPFENLPAIRALRGIRVKNAKISIRHPNKEYFLETTAIPIYNPNGDLTMVVSCFHDITETIEQSRKIEEQKEELEAIIENISAGISIFNNSGQYVLFNKSEREMFYPHYEYIDKSSNEHKGHLYDIDGEKIASENTPEHRVMRGEKFKNMRILVKLPHKTLQIDISGTPIYDSEGKFTLGVLCSRDMTDYFKHEEDIRCRYEILNRMLETFDLPVARLSCPDLKIVNINKKGFDIIKSLNPNVKSIKQLRNEKFCDLFKNFETSEYYQCFSDVLKEKKTVYLNKKKILVNGKELYWNVIFEPMLGVNGEIQEILILIIDVTPEIKSNIVMKKALKLQGEFLVNASHELKTPLNVIFSAAQLFETYCNSGSLDDKKSSIIKYIDSIKLNSYRLSKTINNIVDLSKIEAGFFKLNLSNNNIVQVVEEIVMSITTFTESKGLNVIFDTDVEEKNIAFDTEKIERIILNLISNAIKFTNKGDEILVEVKDKNEFIEISVKDNGIGIENKYLDVIFDRFKQVDKSLSRNAEGTGIGLSLVKSIVELHGGSIQVESVFGKGSKFIFMIPSRKVLNENMLYSSKVPSGNESIRVELSDVYS